MTILSKLWSIPKKRFISIGVQKRRNNYRTMTMLALFPCMVFFLSMLTSLIYTSIRYNENIDTSLIELKSVIIGFLFCLVWLVVAYRVHEKLIRAATGAKSLERRDNMRVYNLVENLCMAVNMPMPKIDVIEDNSLNAFASGINIKTYTITLSRGLIDKLDDSELEAVIAHELTHIKNNDAKVMIVSIIFVGIFSFLGQASILLLLSKFIWRSKALPVAIFIIMFGLFVIIPGYLITLLMRSSISRKREYMADAGGAEMTRNPLALAAALRKISADPHIEAVERKDVAQLFIHNPRVQKEKSKGLFATHPPIEKRIQILEQF
ncbi:MAG: M48 family metallopeptidase [Bacteroidales bacterium]|nr:M48 family metallopeptidase [Bacteroidales bacterium]